MDRTRFERPPKWWGPRLSPFWIRIWRPLRRAWQARGMRLQAVEIHGLEHLRRALDEGYGVMITPNHSAHGDALALYAAADQLDRPFYFMAAWQVLGLSGRLPRIMLRHHGCFSVDREGTDLKAFKCASTILQEKDQPLVIFPEGEVYHLNERVTPFREGPAAIALAAARKATRKIVCVPCGLRYHYVRSPLPELNPLMDELERAMFWRPRPDLPLDRRIYRVAEGMLGLKELEYLGRQRQGDLPERVAFLTGAVLDRLDERYGMTTATSTVPERVKALRQKAIARMEEAKESEGRRQTAEDLEDLYFVVQLFSYPGDYVRERPSIERMAETLDKFEEDVLGRPTATIRGARRATVTFGAPVEVTADRRDKHATENLTRLLEERVQALLDGTAEPGDRSFAIVPQPAEAAAESVAASHAATGPESEYPSPSADV